MNDGIISECAFNYDFQSLDPRVPFQNQIKIKQELDFVVKREPSQESNAMYTTEIIKMSIDRGGCKECRGKQTKIDLLGQQVDGIKTQLLQSKAEHQAVFIRNKQNEEEIAKLQMKLKSQETQIAKLRMMVEKGDPELYDVKEILKHKREKGTIWYFVRWDGYGSEDDSWVKEKDLKCPGILRKYKDSLKN